ncbi:hypothetical protein N0B51_10295 [Tsuneonella sp. YG55]|uniref:Uncharacterized protein n=1 Tax=Tsuneonella litorea TaxID=2976475 RepID=A0A9X3ALJ3_9SPHN|nr:hypothetical protein [Tsuneonella litorea]MCT2559368.1 hypothetical protein [Tsuneonella litorea]
MRYRLLACAAIVCSTAAAMLAAPALSKGDTPTVARYAVDAGTTTGIAGMGAGGGLGAAMRMMRGGSGQMVHALTLRLGSSRAATGVPRADHFMPPAAQLGVSVPLVSPERGQGGGVSPGSFPQGQVPRGRLLLFWGCGERAPAGQPVVIDFSKIASGQVPPGLFAQAMNLPDDWEVLVSNSASYGEWPNGRDSKAVKANASLLGPHRVTSTYAPEISFTLADDFMPPLVARSAGTPTGATRLDWNALPRATGYYAWAMGAKNGGGDDRDMVWWSSAGSQQFGGPLAGWLSPAAVARLVAAKTVMPPAQTRCTIPAEVTAAGGEMLMTQLFAYGPQADFAYPARPANTNAAWRPEWIARVRFRSNTALLIGMPGLDDAEAGAPRGAEAAPAAKPKCKGLKGIAMRAAGLCE